MSFNFPASVEHDIRQYALSQDMSPEEAAPKLVQDALKAKRRKAAKGELTEAEWQKVQDADPGFAFFAAMPDGVIDSIAEANKQTRAERSTPRA